MIRAALAEALANSLSKRAARQQLRIFGLIFGVFFSALSVYPLLHGGRLRLWAVFVAVLFAAAGVLLPGSLRWVYFAWMIFGEALARVNSRIFLCLVYYLLLLPTGIVMRLLGKDPMKRRFSPAAESYRVPRRARPAQHMNNQF